MSDRIRKIASLLSALGTEIESEFDDEFNQNAKQGVRETVSIIGFDATMAQLTMAVVGMHLLIKDKAFEEGYNQ